MAIEEHGDVIANRIVPQGGKVHWRAELANRPSRLMKGNKGALAGVGG
ncbi:MAG: hypothetical protein M3Y91_07760 [Actinomycetota bacterium]|nr:hypothetical protein [Actinomycetota bacterium]